MLVTTHVKVDTLSLNIKYQYTPYVDVRLIEIAYKLFNVDCRNDGEYGTLIVDILLYKTKLSSLVLVHDCFLCMNIL